MGGRLSVCSAPGSRGFQPPARQVVLGLLALSLLSFGCARRVAAPVTAIPLVFSFWALAPAEGELYRSLAAQYTQAHPDTPVVVREIPNRYYQHLQTLFAAGTPPDVFVVNYGRLGDFARRGVLADLDPLLATEPALRLGEYLPQAVTAFRDLGRRVGQPGLPGLPLDWGPANLLLYDGDAFAAAGVQTPRAGWTWTDWAAAAKRLTTRAADPAQRRYGASVCLYPYGALAWLYQGGGDLLSADGKRSELGSAANVRTVEFLVAQARAGAMAPLTPGEDRAVEEFRQGRVAMAFVTPYSLGLLRRQGWEANWGVAPPLRGVRAATSCLPTALAIPRTCRAPQAALRFAAFLATEGAAARARAGLGVPAWQPALGEACDEGFGVEAARVLRQAAPQAIPPPVSANVSYEQMTGILREALEQVCGGGVAPAKALRAAQGRLEGELRGVK